MVAAFMITNGGPHSAEYWAETTVGQIVQAAKDPMGLKLKVKLLEICEAAHRLVQEDERRRLADGGSVNEPNDPTKAVEATLALIVEAASETPFSEHFQKAETREYVRNVLGEHFATSIHIERLWAADHQPA